MKTELKELTVPEALKLLADKYPNPVTGWFWDKDNDDKYESELFCVLAKIHYSPSFEATKNKVLYNHFAIEVPVQEQYMTRQEYFDWVVTVGYKGHQIKHKSPKSQVWSSPLVIPVTDTENWEYRTVELIDGEIHYGEPKEFKVRVK